MTATTLINNKWYRGLHSGKLIKYLESYTPSSYTHVVVMYQDGSIIDAHRECVRPITEWKQGDILKMGSSQDAEVILVLDILGPDWLSYQTEVAIASLTISCTPELVPANPNDLLNETWLEEE